MRSLPVTLILATLVSAPAAAQDGRFSFELTGGQGTNSPIFEHEVPADAAFAASTVTRLAIDGASIGSGRIGYRVTGAWTLVGELGQGSTGYYYSRFVTAAGRLVASEEQWGTATRTAFSLGVAHRSMLGVLPLSIEPELGFAMQRLKVGNPGVASCGPQPPTLGGFDPCFTSQRWERTYSVPSVGVGLSLGYAIAPRVAVQLHGQYSVGRTSTKEGFYDDLFPQLDYAEAPKSQTIRSSHLSIGLRIAP